MRRIRLLARGAGQDADFDRPDHEQKPYYSSKHTRHGVNVQVIADAAGRLVRASPALPGSENDLTNHAHPVPQIGQAVATASALDGALVHDTGVSEVAPWSERHDRRSLRRQLDPVPHDRDPLPRSQQHPSNHPRQRNPLPPPRKVGDNKRVPPPHHQELVPMLHRDSVQPRIRKIRKRPTQGDQPLVERQHLPMLRLVQLRPVQPRPHERLRVLRIRHVPLRPPVRSELPPPPGPHRSCQLRLGVRGEELPGR